MLKGLSYDDDDLIGFIVAAKGKRAITTEEAIQFFYGLIAQYDDLPTYIFELIEAKSYGLHFREVVPFPFSSGLSDTEDKALYGIAYYRGILTPKAQMYPTKPTALKHLRANPQLEKRFMETFPFIDYTPIDRPTKTP